MNVQGLTELRQTLDGMSNAIRELDGHIAAIRFNPSGEQSISEAIKEADLEVDRRLAPYRQNQMVQTVAAQVKVKFADNIRRRAEEARSKPS